WVEAAPDAPDAKRRALARIDALAKPSAILVSTTKFLDLESLAAVTSRPGDLVGLHFASPIEQLKLLECARTPLTLPDALATVMKLGRALGKVTVAVRGHVAHRLRAPYLREALFLLEEGALPQEVDLTLTEFGFRTGPFAALDLLGYEEILEERRVRFAQLTAREQACTLLEELTRLGRTGRASGLGFYRYEGGRAAPDPSIVPLLERHSKARATARRAIAPEEIRERCVFSVINEAARILAEGVAARPLEIDLIGVHGFSFPTYRGGPLFFADQLGLDQVIQRMQRLREQLGEEYWTPAPLIERLRAGGQGFYVGS
ncbi:MAG TPA: 3-hydroxyacyl-CoA dehydrogenase family protein, partial [Polyangiaceae bacterium]|nr:3-hydroxyacyl-CoA dehydrogenase family protein [Polyangiaceae bacterium]